MPASAKLRPLPHILMRHCIYIIFGLILISCSPFRKDRVLNYNSELIGIFDFMQEYDNVTLEIESDDRLADDMRNLKIDYVVKNANKVNVRYSGFVEESDSLLIFIKRSYFLSSPEKRIIYDFAKTPRNFGNDTIKSASYKISQINDRWYFSTVGFD
ncbi:MAG: hypothetical protein CVT94_00970 [Bacteroidetes bacterium HGW-Bacteroidetes-11]|nr:MAG: hypothetical protein CVT94_00970 [Bacteroidetes bacterium HGW-Bacteroidetes-11]